MIWTRLVPNSPLFTRQMSHYKFVVAGGGSGGCAAAANLAKHGSVAIVDPADVSVTIKSIYSQPKAVSF